MAILPKILRGPREPRRQASSIEDAPTTATASVEPVVVVPGWSIEPDAATAVSPLRREDSESSAAEDVGLMPTLDRSSSMGPRDPPWQNNSSPREETPAGEADGLMANTSASRDWRLPELSHDSWDGADESRTSPAGGYFSQPPSANNQRGFAAVRSGDDDDSDDDERTEGRDDIEMLRQSVSRERLSYDQDSGDQRGYADRPSFAQRPERYSEKTFDSRASSFSIYQKGEGLAVSNLAPPPADEAQLRSNLMKVVEGLAVIIGGWATLVLTMYLFKALAVKFNLAASDSTAEWILKHQQSSTQLFTLVGVLLSEICFILWESSIVYFTVRRLAYGRERTEVLTYVAWSELKRAGYTLSGRKKQWPLVTLIVWLGSSFLAPAFTVWLTPSPMTHYAQVSWPELDAFSDAYAVALAPTFVPGRRYQLFDLDEAAAQCSPSQYLTTQYIETSASGRDVKLDLCPQYSNVNKLISAGIVALQAAQNETNALLKLGNSSFLGTPAGVVPIGPEGLLPASDWVHIPSGVRNPKGYPFTYTLEQQGSSVEVNCLRQADDQQPFITSKWTNSALGVANVSYLCPTESSAYVSTLGMFSGQSITSKLCNQMGRTVGPQGQLQVTTDLDSAVISLWDFLSDSVQGSSKFLVDKSNVTVRGQNITSIGGHTQCVVKPYFATYSVTYNSTASYFTSTEVPGTREYLTGKFPRYANNDSYSRDDGIRIASRFQTLLPGLQAMSEVFAGSNTIRGLYPDADNPPIPGNDSTITPDNVYISGVNTAVIAMGDYLLDQRDTSEVQLVDIEIFMRGVFEYVQTVRRFYLTYQGTDIDDNFGNNPTRFGVNASEFARTASGQWNASTLGWGSGQISGDDASMVVYVSLIPIVLFALMSWAIVAWSHYYDRPHGGAYVAECDPTDLTDCIIAASQGGLQGSFHRQALLKKDGGLKGARKVRIRLGQIYRKGEADGLPQLGFVDVD